MDVYYSSFALDILICLCWTGSLEEGAEATQLYFLWRILLDPDCCALRQSAVQLYTALCHAGKLVRTQPVRGAMYNTIDQ